RENIRFNTPVARARRGAQGGWQITLSDGSQESFDALLVCNGHHWSARFPDFPGTFDGPQIHSHDYIDPSDPLDLYGKRVLVVGIGKSASDIVSELGRKTVAEFAFISTRSGAYVVPKYLFGIPADQVVKTNPRVPLSLQRRMARILPRIFSGRMEDFGLPTPDHKFLDAHPTVSSELLGRLGAGDAVAKVNVAELMGDRVRFDDGSVERVDAIIYATGYNISFPFFEADFISAPENVLPLYKRMLKPDIDDLAVIGLGQPIPTIFPFSELQSKIAARWLSGEGAPPAPPEMEAEIKRDEARHTAHFTNKPRHTMQLEWYSFEHELLTRTIPAGQARARAGAPTGRDTAGRGALASGVELAA